MQFKWSLFFFIFFKFSTMNITSIKRKTRRLLVQSKSRAKRRRRLFKELPKLSLLWLLPWAITMNPVSISCHDKLGQVTWSLQISASLDLQQGTWNPSFLPHRSLGTIQWGRINIALGNPGSTVQTERWSHSPPKLENPSPEPPSLPSPLTPQIPSGL